MDDKKNEKQCTTCPNIKDISEFKPSKRHRDGRESRCRECMKEVRRQRYLKNKERDNAKSAEYHQQNKEAVSAWKKEYHSRNAEKRNEYGRQYKQDHKEELAEKQHVYRTSEERKAARNEYERERRKNDPAYRILCNVRGRLKKYLKSGKRSSSIKYIGCSSGDLKLHLEAQFYPDPKTGEVMSWGNYGLYGWHIDHIIPLSSFDLSNEEEFAKATHYTNLQPLWCWQNLEKADKVEPYVKR